MPRKEAPIREHGARKVSKTVSATLPWNLEPRIGRSVFSRQLAGPAHLFTSSCSTWKRSRTRPIV